MRWSKLLLLTTLSLLGSWANAYSQRVLPAEKIYLSTDRYYFDPSEYVDYAVFLATDNDATPKSVKVKIWLENAMGKTLDSSITHTFGNAVGGIFQLPAKGGIYYLKAISLYQQNYEHIHPIVKELFVQESVTSNFFVDIKLDKNSYTAADAVQGKITCTAAGNSTTELMPVTIRMLKDGTEIARETLFTDENGSVTSTLKLPQFEVNTESVFYLTASCEYRGQTYSQTRKIPTSKRKAIISAFYAHGNSDYLLGIPNQLVIKSEDDYGNTLDIKGKLATTAGKVIRSFESYAEGLASITFTPQRGESYAIIRGSDTILLAPAVVPIGLSLAENNRKLTIQTVGNHKGNYQVVVTHRGQLVLDAAIPENTTQKVPAGTPGIYAITLLLDGVEVARRDYFAGYDQLKRTQITLKDSVTTAQNFKYIDVANATQYEQLYSVAIVKEDNLKQIENKSHNSMTWLLLGSEYATEIERPQRYFDPKNKKARQTLDLLMHTLHPAAMRDALSGAMKANNTSEVANAYRIGGVLRPGSYMASIPTGNVRIQIKNTNVFTYTDSVGNFQLDVPAGMETPLILVARKGLNTVRFIPNYPLSSLRDYSPAFAQRIPLKDMTMLEVIPKNQKLAASSLQIGFKYRREVDRISNVEESSVYMSQPLRSRDIAAIASTTSSQDFASLSIRSLGSYYYYYQPSGIVPSFNLALYDPTYQEPYYITLTQKRVKSNSTARTIHRKKATLYWKPHHTTKGRKNSRVPIKISAPLGGYRITIEGVDGAGNFIYGEKYLVIKEKLDVETNIPNQLYLGDQASVPISITNNMDTATQAVVTLSGLINRVDTIILKPLETRLLSYPAGQLNRIESSQIAVAISSDGFAFMKREIVVVSTYKIQESENVGGDISQTKNLNLSNAEQSSVVASFQIYPSFNEQVKQIAKNLLRQPGGCFEQVSSSNYPNIATMLLMRAANDKQGTDYNRAKQYVQSGYKQLAAYETPTGGFEWYGRNPPHESLTAYGLLQFHLIQEVGFTIDRQQYKRTIDWLLGQRDRKGGFKFHRGKYGFASAPYAVNNAYITWVLSRISSENIKPQLDAIERDVNQNFDAYKVALLVNALYEKQQFGKAKEYYTILKNHILKQDFTQLKAYKSVVNAYGDALDAEVRALALFAAMAANDMPFALQLKSAILKSINGRGYFGSTQATALSLEALARLGMLETAQYAAKYTVLINGEKALSVDYRQEKKLEHVLPANMLNDKINTITIETNGTSLPYNLNIQWIEKRTSNVHPELDFDVTYAKDKVAKGEYNLLSIAVQNTLDEAKGQVVATINIPETYTISTEELRNMVRLKEVDYYELQGNTLHLYFLEMGPKEKKLLTLNLKANFAGSYHSAAHQVFEYYHPETVSKIISPVTVVQ